ncbi:hypothetical protein Xcel_2555 [Xylanimonas cellulosilytica DSM 15894]|uniref:Glycosyltransferase RgtA/B/C/D-like domain-containing protein n=1 Tax=Xylanimonas cellulosilytica (strain DSM 15894 / JCM 12276 / CECT 5975 / KCTC 9989 / LMG 20990 / NBRC 107835 / XIL07) TaxID=446471 RepID=D1BX02_XYLCX|nr:DUF2142 domain-containing protein [Xylanimonas cellulosilytica]ACZ31570.1 hypothetical protein Xcel_2555 [Xylanimonas cellulosilytica DSM 15894]
MSEGGARPDAGWRRALAALLVVVAAWGTVWALLTPAFRSPDEQTHLNSVLRLAHGGGWPAPGDAYVAPVIVAAEREAGWPSDLPGRRTPRAGVPQFVDLVASDRADRTRIDAGNALPAQPPGRDAVVDQMTQHPPAWYALGAVTLHLTGLADGRWDHALLALRLLDVALLVATVPFAVAAARRLTRSWPAALVAGTFPLFVPEIGNILGSANNDALVVLATGVVTWLSVRVVTGDTRWRTAVALGLVLGVGLLTKVMPAFAIPGVVAAYALAPWGGSGYRRTWWPRLARLATAGTLTVAAGGWWWVRNVLTTGAVQPVGRMRDVSGMTEVPADQVLTIAVRRVAQSFWGHLSWLEVWLPWDFVVAGTLVLVAAAVVALVLPGARRGAVVLVLLPTALTAGVIFNAWQFWSATGRLVALHGRYVYAAIAALGALVAVALWQVLGRRESRTRVALPVVTGLALAAGGAGLWWAFGAFYRGPGESVADAVARWSAWSPLGPTALTVVVVTAAVAALAAWVVLTRDALTGAVLTPASLRRRAPRLAAVTRKDTA